MYMYPVSEPIAYPHIAIASSTLWGSPSSTDLSINAPGSPSSALHTTNFLSVGPAGFFEAASHLEPVGKPAPPLPRRPEVFTSAITSWGVREVKHLPRAK